ncbi:MAG: hypothetical protein CMF63_03170 [Magnetovibrio sp.]|nr:hypothetical protein [Magnetovibrio sp.]
MKKRLILVLGFLFGFSGLSASAIGRTLEESMTAAYDNNPTILAQRAKVRATDEEVAQALSNWRPTVEIVGEAGTSAVHNNTATATNQGQHREPRSLNLTIEQALYRGGRTLAATSEAENSVKAERARLLVVEQSVLLDAATEHMNVIRDQAVLELNINNEQVLRRQLKATRERFEVGEVTSTDVHQAQARLARVTADRIQSEGDLVNSRAGFLNSVGEAAGKLLPAKPPMDLPASVMEAVKIAVNNDPNVIAAEFDERALLDNVDEVRGELLPTLSVEGTASRSFQSSSEESRSDVYKAKAVLTVPLYQSGEVYSRLREAKQDAAEQRLKTDQAQRNAAENSTIAWQALQTARARIVSYVIEVEAAQIALDGVKHEATVGSRTTLDVLDAEQELLDASVNLVRAERDEMVAIFELKTAMGQMTASLWNLPVRFYDPDAHYREIRNKWFGARSNDGIPEK